MTAGADRAAGFAGEQDGEVMGIVAVAVAQSRAEDDHGVVEERGVAVAVAAQFAEEIGELLGVPRVDAGVLLEFFLGALVVGDLVVAAERRIEEGEIPAADGIAEHEGADAGGVGPEGEGEQVEHESGSVRCDCHCVR